MKAQQNRINDQLNDDINELLTESCKRQLIEDGLMVLTDSGYSLTARGMKSVQKEFRRYEMRPAMAMMMEIYILNRHEVPVW
ncbi:hypothetical protein LJK88_38460 [Paenibacillus sp. P26]|nr:hypothetical protein LJK88_38460 [Paenibacillus sp. P26]UUZ93186.1 hypothetical protein LJK87_49830 [Paenibacillus sp. P25]